MIDVDVKSYEVGVDLLPLYDLCVCMPVYNGFRSQVEPRWLSDAIDSVLRNLGERDILFIIDNGSTDGTWDYLCAFDMIGKNVSLCRLPFKAGIAFCYNMAIRSARSKYFTYVHSDDMTHEGYFAKAVSHLNSNINVAVVGGVPAFMDDDGKVTRYDDIPLGDQNLSGFFLTRCVNVGPVFRTAAIYRVGMYDELNFPMMAEDLDMYLKISELFMFHFFDTVGYYTRVVSEQNQSLSINTAVHERYAHIARLFAGMRRGAI